MIEPLNRRVFLAGLAATGSTVGAPAIAAGAPTFTLVLTNDIYKMNEDGGHGGIPRLAAVVKAERAKSPNVIFTHAGDTLSPSLMSGFDQGAHMIALFNEIGLDVFAPGNHEFDFGRETYLKRMGEAQFPILAANLRDGDGSALPHHRDSMIMERGGLKIGIVGATLEDTPSKSSPGNLRFGPEIEAIAAESRALKRQGADIIIALVHADKEIGQRMMAARVADLIISGHNHDLHIDFDGRCALVESGEDANFAVAIDVATVVKGEGAARTVAWAPTFRVYDTADVKPDLETLEKVKVFEADLSKELDVDVATIGEPLDSRTATVRGGEAAIGNLIADALRIQNNAQIAIVNGGGIRANKQYKPGDKLTRRDILAELPFGNKSVVTRVTGKAIWASLENGVSQVEQRAGRYPQVSGLTATVDYNAPVGARVLSIDVDGKPIDETKVYTVATNDFMVRGGDGYTALADPNASNDTGDKLIANDVMVFARRLGVVNAKVEGRIVVK